MVRPRLDQASEKLRPSRAAGRIDRLTAGSGAQTAFGIGFALLGTISLTLMFFLPKLAGIDAHPIQISFLRYLGGLLLLVGVVPVWLATRSREADALHVPARAWGAHFARALIGMGSLAFAVYAASKAPIGDVQAILATHGAFLIVLLIVLDRERVSGWIVAATSFSILGAVVAANPLGSGHAVSTVAYVAAFGSALLWALEIYVFRNAAQYKNVPILLLGVNAFGAVVLLLPGVWVWRPLRTADITIVMLMGPLAVIAQVLTITAMRHTAISILAPYRYASVPFAAILGWLILREVPNLTTLLGMGMVILGGMIVSLHIWRPKGPRE
jgi:drug/metabolite transporter (DMT)-like permease